MDNRSRTSRYPKTDYRDDREYISFRSIHNAALQPEYYPAEPQRKVKQQPKPTLVPQQQPKPKSKALKHMKMLMVAVAITACACCLLVRNAQVYANNKEIQELGKQIEKNTISVNGVKKDIATQVDLVEYLQVAQDDLHMDYPKEEQIYKLTVQPEIQQEQELTKIQKSGNVFDKVLDWFNSLERRS